MESLVPITNTSRLILNRKIIAVYSENHTKCIKSLRGQSSKFLSNVITVGTNNDQYVK
jgi:hypothetical protein